VTTAGLVTAGGINAGAAGALTTGSGDALAKTIEALAAATVPARVVDGDIDASEVMAPVPAVEGVALNVTGPLPVSSAAAVTGPPLEPCEAGDSVTGSLLATSS